MKTKIQLEVHKIRADQLAGVVRVSGEAELKLRELCRATGLPVKYVASQLIIQGSDMIEIVEV